MSDDARTHREAAGRPVAVVLAVKGLGDAKSRLADVLDSRTRQELVLAMLADTVAAAWDAGADDVIVVTPDTTVAAAAQSAGARAVDEPAPAPARRWDAASPDPAGPPPGGRPGTSSLNSAFGRGIDAAHERAAYARVAVVQADLAALRPRSLAEALSASRTMRRAMVPDRSGDGTAMLVLADPVDRVTLFGAGSARAHRDSGALDLTVIDTGTRPGDRWADLRTDVDTADDLAAALALGVGPRTADALAGVTQHCAMSCSGPDPYGRPDAS